MKLHFACTLLAALANALAGTPLLNAQSSGPLPSVDSIINQFNRETVIHDRRTLGVHLIVMTLNQSPYSPRQDSLLRGLERLVDTSPDKLVRRAAAQWLAFAGEDGRAARPLPRIVRRLERVYRKHGSDDYGVRLAIVSSLPLQGERTAAAALLRGIASEPDPGNNGTGPHGYLSVGDLRTEALTGLSTMGQEGRAVLQALHRNKTTLSPQAQIVLERMAQRGFPVSDTVERRRAATRQLLQQQ